MISSFSLPTPLNTLSGQNKQIMSIWHSEIFHILPSLPRFNLLHLPCWVHHRFYQLLVIGFNQQLIIVLINSSSKVSSIPSAGFILPQVSSTHSTGFINSFQRFHPNLNFLLSFKIKCPPLPHQFIETLLPSIHRFLCCVGERRIRLMLKGLIRS